MTLSTAQRDRACGVLLATAAGDALGAPYEFQPPRGPELEVAMVGGGGFGWEPGEWTDDTAMAIAIAEVAATGTDLRDESAQDAIVARWHDWCATRERRWCADSLGPGRGGSARHHGRAGAHRIGSCTTAPVAPRATAR